jgi:hypothetical protein
VEIYGRVRRAVRVEGRSQRAGIPGLVLAFDDYGNPANSSIGWPQDPQVPYLGVVRTIFGKILTSM